VSELAAILANGSNVAGYRDRLPEHPTADYVSLFSGIEAASSAWGPLGWRPMAFAEIEAFPSAVLAHHYPDVPNLGDVTAVDWDAWKTEHGTPDVLVAGSPCQAFSVAGKRLSLEDARGNLSLFTAELVRFLEPGFFLWENVPGVLNTSDNAFGCLIAELVGAGEPCIPAGGRWGNAGAVMGPEGRLVWRVLDAQWFGLAQRRKRVFLVRCPADGADPAEVLFEWEGLQRHSAPSREAGQGAAGTLTSRASGGGGGPGAGTDEAAAGYLQPVAVHESQRGELTTSETAGTLKSGGGKPGQGYPAVLTLAIRGRDGHSDVETRGDGTANAILTPSGGRAGIGVGAICITGDVTHTLTSEGADASEDGRDTLIAICPLEGLEDASAQETNAGTVLRDMREEVGAQATSERRPGVSDSFQQAEVLRQAMLLEPSDSTQGRSVLGDGPLPCSERLPTGALCELRSSDSDGRASCGLRLAKQRARAHKSGDSRP
jgi:site-specific DNA-cytosine methylase